MAPRRRASIRFWQTGLFVVVIVVAILILSGSLSAGLQATLSEMSRSAEARNASALARRLGPEFPLDAESSDRVDEVLLEYRSVYGAGIWVYDRGELLVHSSYDTGPSEPVLAAARRGALEGTAAYAEVDLRPGGWSVAARTIFGADGAREGVVVTASPVDDSLRILDAVRHRLWITFWISLGIAGLIGFAFSEIIRRRVDSMLGAAAAIAAGDFEQRVPVGMVPDEIGDLAVSYNQMAVRLGAAFGAIEESRRQIAAVVQSMAEGVVAFDATGTVRVMNPEAERLLGLTGDGSVGQPAEEVAAAYPDVRTVVDAALEGQSTARIARLGTFTCLLNCTTLFDAEGRVDGAVLLLTDVTEQRRIEEAQRRFVADASHEMRTPIAALKGILELLGDGAAEDPEVRDDFIATMQIETDRLGRLVADLLTLAQIDAGSMRLTVEPHDAGGLLDDVARIMRTLAAQADVRLEVERPGRDARVLCDRDRVVQVLLGLTDNAIKHSSAGGGAAGTGATGDGDRADGDPGERVVRLGARVEDGGRVRFVVSDQGPGIAAEHVERVFERFYQADSARPGRGGAGLGLAIAREIVEAHGSSIEVDSARGKGTAFAFTLPLESAPDGAGEG